MLKVIKSEPASQKNAIQDYPHDLIQRCRKCDPAAQLQVYKLYYRRVFSICIQIVEDPVIAEEIMHESFLTAFENINSYSGEISFSGWIATFVKMLFRRYISADIEFLTIMLLFIPRY
jgi:DNA-directed RNA polymerase specialized sigma24 family protein